MGLRKFSLLRMEERLEGEQRRWYLRFAAKERARLQGDSEDWRCVLRFFDFQRRVGVDWLTIHETLLGEFLAELGEGPLSRTSRQRVRNYLRRWLGYLWRSGLVVRDWRSEVERVAGGRSRTRRALELREVRQLLAGADLSSLWGQTTRTILETAYGCGLRPGELLLLEVADVDLVGSSLTVRTGKGQRGRTLPLPGPTCWWLAHYLEKVRPAVVGARSGLVLFLDGCGNPLDGDSLTPRLRRGLVGCESLRWSVYRLRHSCATHLLRSGVAVDVIAEFLGHRCLQSTQVYTQMQQRELTEVVRRFHPRGV